MSSPAGSAVGPGALRSRRYGWYVLGVLVAANFLHYGNRNVLVSMYDDLRVLLDLSNAELGLLQSAFMATHAPATLLFGWAGDRFDRRRVIAFGLALWSVAGVASVAADSFAMLVLSRAAVGLGTAACVPLANALLCQVFPRSRKASTVAIFNLGLFVGGAAGIALGATPGYPAGILVLALPGLILAILALRLDVPARGITDETVPLDGFLGQVAELVRVPTLRWTMLGATLMAFASGGYLAWIFDFLAKDKGLGEDRTLVVLGVGFVGGLLGVLAGGQVADRLQRRVPFGRLAAISLGMIGTVPCTLFCIYFDTSPVYYVVCWLNLFFITWYHGPMAAVVDDLAPPDRTTTAQALVIFTMHLVGTTPSSWVVGELADRWGLQQALLLPTLCVLLASLALVGGWRTMASDRARASEPAAGRL